MPKNETELRLYILLNAAMPDAPFDYALDYSALAENAFELVELLLRLEADKADRP